MDQPQLMFTFCHTGYPLMSKALNATGRPMAYSCSWPVYLGGLPPNVSVITKSLSNPGAGSLRLGQNCANTLKQDWITAIAALKLKNP